MKTKITESELRERTLAIVATYDEVIAQLPEGVVVPRLADLANSIHERIEDELEDVRATMVRSEFAHGLITVISTLASNRVKSRHRLP